VSVRVCVLRLTRNPVYACQDSTNGMSRLESNPARATCTRHFTSLHHSATMPAMELTSISNSRAWYSASIADFRQTQPEIVLGLLAANGYFSLISTQRDAWIAEINLLRTSLDGLAGSLFLEFSIPRMGRRIDAVILVGPVVFVVEFKVGEKIFDRVSLDQVWDYALDLKNFHEASHAVAIVPILVATEATGSVTVTLQADEDNVYRPISVGAGSLREVLDLAVQRITGCTLDDQQWARAPYHPTPTIVEAARCLYAQHSVEAIARHDAGAQNLRVTSQR
jgi:hypothetical protein